MFSKSNLEFDLHSASDLRLSRFDFTSTELVNENTTIFRLLNQTYCGISLSLRFSRRFYIFSISCVWFVHVFFQFYIAYSFELLELITGSLAIMYSVYSYERCSGTDPDVTCLPDRDALLAMSLLGTIVNSLMTSLAAIDVILQTIVKSRAVKEVHRVQSEEKSRTETA